MKGKRPYNPPIIDLQVDHTGAVGVSRCVAGGQATGQCPAGARPTVVCARGLFAGP